MVTVLALAALLGCLVTIGRTAIGHGPSVRYLIVATGASAAGFAARVATTSAEQVDGQWWVTSLWIVGFCAVAAAAWHPGLAALGDDLNGFKAINDQHGHHAGDAVLAVVARRLCAALRADDLVARFGGDEFVVVAEGDPAVIPHEVVRRITAALTDPIHVGGLSHQVSAATGTVVALPGDGATAERLLSAADAAMYHDKRREDAHTSTSDQGTGTPG